VLESRWNSGVGKNSRIWVVVEDWVLSLLFSLFGTLIRGLSGENFQ
jgi:hypothetical protein